MRLGLGPGCGLKDLPETRRFAREVAQVAGLGEERSYDLTVAVSEASANAIEHGNAEAVDIEAVMNDDSITISVSHAGRFVVPQRFEETTRGLGLPLMAALCDDLTVCRTEEGIRLTLGFRR